MFFRMNRGVKIVIIILSFFGLLFFFIQNTLNPIFISQAEVKATDMASRIINQAVNEEAGNIRYEDLIRYVSNNDGEIIMMQANTNFINIFNSNIALRIQNRLAEISKLPVKMPLFRILGMDLLAGFGPDLEVRVVPVGFARPPQIIDSFTSAGINQTRHKIYLLVTVQLKLIVPFRMQLVEVESRVPVTEVTILGRVPRVYVGLDGEELKGIIHKE